MILLYIFIFLGSLFILYWSGSKLVRSLVSVCQILGWREFVVAFLVMAAATSVPNLFIDINAALQKIPQLAFGDIVGGNIVDLTLVIGLAVLLSNISLPAESKMVQSSAVFTMIIALLPLILILDGKLDRIDGAILILAFFIYIFWLFSNEERFSKIYKIPKKERVKGPKPRFLKILYGTSSAFFFIGLLLLASEGIILSAQYFSSYMGLSLSLIGILIVGLGNCAPETYFTAISARRDQNWMILGNLMGSVIICTTLVLGMVVLICPVENVDFSPFLIARIFTIISAVLFFIVLRTGHKITKKEGLALLLLYFAFLLTEIYFK